MQPFLALLPEGLSVLFAAILVAAAFVTSAITAAFGIGGGVALLAVMASMVPVAVLIPVHGVVQLGSNAGRAIVQRAHILWPLIGIFTLGAVAGALIGGQLVVSLPEALLKALVGLFILFTVWGPKPRGGAVGNRWWLALVGFLATLLTMFVGATGPFVAAHLAARLADRRHYVATHAMAMVVQHALKVLAFGLLGFAFADWVPLMAAMIAAGFAGTLLGTRLLHALPEARFRVVFRWLLTALAAQLVLSALWGWWQGA